MRLVTTAIHRMFKCWSEHGRKKFRRDNERYRNKKKEKIIYCNCVCAGQLDGNRGIKISTYKIMEIRFSTWIHYAFPLP